MGKKCYNVAVDHPDQVIHFIKLSEAPVFSRNPYSESITESECPVCPGMTFYYSGAQPEGYINATHIYHDKCAEILDSPLFKILLDTEHNS